MIHREPATAYQAREAVSAGFLWEMVKPDGCPALAYHNSVFNRDGPPIKRSLEFDIGAAAHLLCLEGKDFAARSTLIPYESYASKDARGLRDQAYIDGRVPLRPQDYRLVCDLHNALRNSAAAELLYGNGENEVSFTWTDDIFFNYKDRPGVGIACKARADRITPEAIIDLKTAVSASPQAFQKAMIRDGHHLRAAWYIDGLKESGGDLDAARDYLFVVVAKTPPHLVSIYRIGERSLEWGRRLYRKTLSEFRQARESGKWRGYQASGCPALDMVMELPAFAENMLIAQERNGEFDVENDDEIPY